MHTSSTRNHQEIHHESRTVSRFLCPILFQVTQECVHRPPCLLFLTGSGWLIGQPAPLGLTPHNPCTCALPSPRCCLSPTLSCKLPHTSHPQLRVISRRTANGQPLELPSLGVAVLRLLRQHRPPAMRLMDWPFQCCNRVTGLGLATPTGASQLSPLPADSLVIT